jgi:hypothetical protein
MMNSPVSTLPLRSAALLVLAGTGGGKAGPWICSQSCDRNVHLVPELEIGHEVAQEKVARASVVCSCSGAFTFAIEQEQEQEKEGENLPR